MLDYNQKQKKTCTPLVLIIARNYDRENYTPLTGISDSKSNEHRQCRICYGDSSETNTLGRLISPCQCRGTMKYVHIVCLNEWRLHSAGQQSFFRCDQCGYRYLIQRTEIAKWVDNACKAVN